MERGGEGQVRTDLKGECMLASREALRPKNPPPLIAIAARHGDVVVGEHNVLAPP